jgi:DNA-binding HxlR family transcriptional regulator
MRWDEIDDSLCSLARTLGVIGDRWTLLVLREAFLGTRRYDEFQRHLAAAPHIVAARLKKLVEHKVLEKRRYQDHPPRYEYRLTERGHELYPALIALITWGETWLKSTLGPASIRTHKSCSHRLHVVTTCAACGEAVTARDVKAVLTPRFAAERARRAAAVPGRRTKASA